MKTKTPAKKRPAAKGQRRKRPLHIHLSLHPITIFFLLCVGVFLVNMSLRTLAASTNLSMQIKASMLTSPAVITDPPDQKRFSSPDITVSGTCPADSYVKIYDNGVFAGAASCMGGKFQLMITLVAGTNVLQAKVYNISNDEGPTSPSVTVYYDVPATPPKPTPQPAAGPAAPKSPPAKSDPFRIITDYSYRAYQSGQEVTLALGLQGGSAPYAVAVDWGDGQISSYSRPDSSPFKAFHTYKQEPRLHTYIVKIAASDIGGRSAYLQLITVVDGSLPAAAPTKPATPTTSSKNFGWLKFLWPAYLILVLMVICFWLGEREELRILAKNQRTPLRR